ncbi:MAG: N-6 DNA methylase [Paludibacteraceae bacterium]|nr:N-6 DNA methylase [Paludibacteraceae bacterium]
MAFFQETILKKYKAMLLKEQTDEAWQKYQAYFLNLEIQDNIRRSKEEQFQEGFLRELFVKILGYTLNPSPNFNLITEQKNETDSKKADGAIKLNDKVIGIIELKDHKTTDLKKVEPQAFQYKSQNKEARYVIISNFEKLRLYIDNATEHREWNLFTITESEFEELYCCLAWTQVQKGIAIQMKEASVSVEKDVTKVLYRDYSLFKNELFEDILKNNSTQGTETQEWQLLLYKKTQKLLDRLLFIFFAEDSGLLPPNSMVKILDQWQQLKELDEEVPLYNRIKKYFGYLDNGNAKMGIFAYNGDLFHMDDILDSLIISDNLLYKHTKKLSEYDFKSDVDVNILGHIFEHSLSEIEEVTQRIMGLEPNASKSKRKKDGVFYTPSYITKYIVENTVGKLCTEKKQELDIKEEEYFADRKRQKQTKIQLLNQLKTYREWLLQITILDPACGSGAFLNAALSFLMDEHHLIDEMEAKITGASIIFPDIENSILENNLFGVDINEESVEIAQLALWLRTAKPQRKLNSLNKNIKCGNSLINDPDIAGDKAFDWEKEFPQVFEKGGFDVVVGNPPYVNMVNITSKSERSYYQNKYKTVKNKCDLYSIFVERSQQLLRTDGLLGFIFPNSWMGTDSFSKLREFLVNDVSVYQLVELPPNVFEDAIVTTVLCFYHNTKPNKFNAIDIYSYINNDFYKKNFVLKYQDIYKSHNNTFSFEKTISIENVETLKLGDIVSFSLGIKTSDDNRFVFQTAIDDTCHKFLRGRNIQRWSYPINNEWLWYQPALICEKPGGRPRVLSNFIVEKKIVIQDIAKEINATIDTERYLCNDTLNIIYDVSDKYLIEFILCLLNSNFINIWFKKTFPAGLHIKVNQLEQIPIPIISREKQLIFIDLACKMLTLTKTSQEKRNRFLHRLEDNFQGVKITGALSTFDQMEFADFLKELKKQKITLKLIEQDEWEEYFNSYRSACLELTKQISETDKEIDFRVYKLYGLTFDEVLIVDAEFSVSREDYDNRG